MTGLEITLFILGTAFIIISFFIVGNNESSAKNSAMSALEADSFEQLRSDVMTKTVKEADIILHEAEDKLETLSNDKIIAVGEYSDQMLEKISANHKEVVFLYQMLNEKEEELKATALKMENIRVDCEKLLKEAKKAEQYEQAEQPERSEQKTVEAVVPRRLDEARQAAENSTSARASSGTSKNVTPAAKGSAAAAKKTANASKTGTVKRKQPPVSEPIDSGVLNRNDEIIALHKSGKSVMEISKLLGMGQGEVKLIISLYC